MLGTEFVSNLFEFNITLVSKDSNLQGKDIIGQPITLEIDTEAGSPRYLNGLVTDFGYIGEDEDEEDYHAYTCTARPFMWYLTQNRTAGYLSTSPFWILPMKSCRRSASPSR